MPSISMFFGIVITMNYVDHQPPHFHARYGKHKASFSLDGDLIVGDMPAKQLKLIAAWATIHSDELSANWDLAREREQLYKIDPLR